MLQAVSLAITDSLENRLFDQFAILWWADYLAFCAEYDKLLNWCKAKSGSAINTHSMQQSKLKETSPGHTSICIVVIYSTREFIKASEY